MTRPNRSDGEDSGMWEAPQVPNPKTRSCFVGRSAPEVPPTFRRISAIFLKLLPLVVGGTRLRVAQAVQMISSLRSDEGGVAAVENLCIIRAS